MLTGALRAQGVHASEMRVRRAIMEAYPVNHAIRVTNGHRRFNPVPYNSQYFGHKLHLNLNEKLVDCVLIGAIDGYSGMLMACFAVHRKSTVDVCQMYRDLITSVGIWDQIRVNQIRDQIRVLFDVLSTKFPGQSPI